MNEMNYMHDLIAIGISNKKVFISLTVFSLQSNQNKVTNQNSVETPMDKPAEDAYESFYIRAQKDSAPVILELFLPQVRKRSQPSLLRRHC